MSVNKEQVFTMAAAFGIVKGAIQKITKNDGKNTDTIIFNSLNRAVARKQEKKDK